MSNTTLPLKELKFKAYRQDEPTEGNYFRLPKALFVEPYSNLSLLAKNVYALLLDRMELSRKNGWVDESGELFIFFEREEIAKILNYNICTIVEAFKELRRYELIKEIRQGIKKANIIYPGKIASNCLNTEKPNSRLRKNQILDFGKTEGNDPEVDLTKSNKPENNCKREFSGKPENSPPSQDNEKYTKWIRINTLKFPNSLPEYTVKRFIWSYKRHIGEEHPPLENQQLERCFNVLSSFFNENDIVDYDDIDKIIDCYFKANFPNANSGAGCDYRLNHFATEGVLQNRFWEELY